MRKYLLVFLCLVIVMLGFTGCKIELPDQVAVDEPNYSTQNPSEGDYSESELTSDVHSEQDNNSTQSVTDETTSSSSSSTSDQTTNSSSSTESKLPKPVEPEEVQVDKNKVKYCYLSIECKTILNNMSQFNKDKISILPSDGVIFAQRKVIYYEGESVFDVLNRETKKNRIHMEFEPTPIYNSNYIEGISNIYEFDCGELSGWMYSVNGIFPNYGVSRYKINDGDKIEFRYTCDLGRDLGHYWEKEK